MLRQEPGIKIFPTCGHVKAYRGSFCWDYGTGVMATRCLTLRDGRRIVIPGGGSIHAAHDIHGERGASIYAVETAEVLMRNTNRPDPDGGWMIKIRALEPGPFGEKRTYFHSHLDEPAFFGSGDIVKAGDIIGVMGDSGNARGRGVHLHFQAVEQVGRRGVVPIDVYDELIEALEMQEGVAPHDRMVALEGLKGLDEYGLGYGSFSGAAVNREEGDFVSCHIPEHEARSGAGAVAGILAVAGLAAGVGYLWWKS